MALFFFALAVLGRSLSGQSSEGPIEGARRRVTDIGGDADDRQIGAIEQLAGLLYAIAIQEIVEVAESHLAVDQAPEPVLLYGKRAGQLADCEAFLPVDAIFFQSFKQAFFEGGIGASLSKNLSR